MGTNYYLHTDFCPTCKHPRKVVHIGKDSWGWVFHFQEINIKGYKAKNLAEMKEITKLGRIFNEYDEEITYNDFWEIVEETKDPMPDGSPKWITHDDTEPEDIPFCWEKDGFAWTNRDFS